MTRWALLVCLAATDSFAQVDGLLHGLALETELKGPINWAKVELSVAPRDPKVAPALFLTRRRAKADPSEQYVLAGLDWRTPEDKPVARHRSSSWVMDFDQAIFKEAIQAARTELGDAPTLQALTDFTRRFIGKKSYDRGIDLASQVARRREGDCTEHAVFLTALLRGFGFSARAMVGVVLVATENAPVGYGHMWVEAIEEGKWRVFDAALPSTLSVAYLPSGEFSDEGPGYTLPLLAHINALGFRTFRLAIPKR